MLNKLSRLNKYEPFIWGDAYKYSASKRINVLLVRLILIASTFLWGLGIVIYLLLHFKPDIIENISSKISKAFNSQSNKNQTKNIDSPIEANINQEFITYPKQQSVDILHSQLNQNKMKVTISIDQQAKSTMFGLGSTKHSYKLNVQFTLAEKERKIFNDHPLLQEMIFMQYMQGKRRDIPLNITAKDIYSGRPISMEASSVNEMIDFRNEVNEASEKFVGYIDILTDILGGKEISYGD